MPTPPTGTAVGDTLEGRYRIDALIAFGGMATVYRGHDIRLNRAVAIKVVYPHLAASFSDHVIAEARQAARISHPNVVTVHDFGISHGQPFIVMEHIVGHSARDLLTTAGTLSAEQACALLLPVAAGLAAAHAAGIVHGDLKPENILIGDDGRVKITDFGLARAAQGDGRGVTVAGGLIGTPAYLSPEYVQGHGRTVAGDVYALGIIAYELVVGAPPFQGANPLQVVLARTDEPVPAPSLAVTHCPDGYDRLVSHATTIDPAERTPSAGAFAEAVKQLRRELPAPRPLPRIEHHHTVDSQPTEFALRATSILPEARDRSRRRSPAADKRTRSARAPGRAANHRPRRRRRTIVFLLTLAAIAGGGHMYAHRDIPVVAGQRQTDAIAAVRDAGYFRANVRTVYADTAVGEAMGTEPMGRAYIWQPITIRISRGPRTITVPDVTRMTAQRATEQLATAGFSEISTIRKFSEQVAAGFVIDTKPGRGATVRSDTAVAVTVSKGREPITVPDVIALRETTATGRLTDLRLRPTVSRSFSDIVEKGRVIRQSPAAGSTVFRGQQVGLVISRGPRTVVMPNVYKLKSEQAAAQLRDLGLTVSVRRPFGSPYGRVVKQSIRAGSTVRVGSTVVLTVV